MKRREFLAAKAFFGILRIVVVGLLIINVGVATPAYAAGPDLTVSISHVGNFDVSSTGAFTINVGNVGDAQTSGTATVTISLPQGINLEPTHPGVGENGTDWACDTTVENIFGPDTVVCTNSDLIFEPPNNPNVYPDITLNVRVSTSEFGPGQYPSQRTVDVSVSGGGDSNSSNNSDSDTVDIIFSELAVTNVTFNPAKPIADEPFEINVTVKNNGLGASESQVDRDVWVNVDPHAFITSVGCADSVPSDFYRSDFNAPMPPSFTDTKPVSTLEHGGSPTYGGSLPTGTYQIYVMVDASCINQETNETNNIYGPITLRIAPPVECGHIFGDVNTAYWACSWIETLYSYNITGGCSLNPLSYCPDSPVTRAQMAVFLERGKHTPNPYSPPNVAPTFLDTVGHWAEDWIEALKVDNITSGCGNGNYCPDSATTRAQMAVFLLKSKYGSSYTPPAPTGIFNDVPTNYWAAAWIEKLAADGITSGCGNNNYCPESPVTRAQMAVFLVRTFNLP